MTPDTITQTGFAVGVAVYLIIFLVKDLKSSQVKILSTLERIVEALQASGNTRNKNE